MRNETEIKQRLRQRRQQAYEASSEDEKATLRLQIQELEWMLEDSTWEAREKAPAVNKPAQEMFDLVRTPRAPVALMSGYFEDKPVSVVAFIDKGEEYTVIQPMYIEVTKHILPRLRDPDGKLPEQMETD